MWGKRAKALSAVSVMSLLLGALHLLTPAVATGMSRLPRPVSVRATADDMQNHVAWRFPSGARARSFRLYRAVSESGPWRLVGSVGGSARSANDPVTETGTYYYQVVADLGRTSSSTSAVARNSTVAMSRAVGPAGATLRAANGAITLTIPAGALDATRQIAVAETTRVEAVPRSISAAPRYDFSPDGLVLRRPAQLTLSLDVGVRHFQVADSLMRAAELMTFDAASSRWTTATSSVDATQGLLRADIGHFSYWTSAIIQPHGTTPSKTSYCSGICHDLVVAPGSPIVLPSRDPQVCYNCHGNTGAALPAAGSLGLNIQAQFFGCPGQSFDPGTGSRHGVRAPGGTTGLACTQCHDPHRDPSASPKLLRAYDADGRAVASKDATGPGNAYCFACHGTRSNSRVEAVVPGYWQRTGGDRQSFLAGTPHDSLTSTAASGARCLACHTPHASTLRQLLPARIAGSAVSNDGRSACLACHSAARGTWNGNAVYSRVEHATVTTSTHAAVSAPGTSATPGGCANCHDPHGRGFAKYARAGGNDLCSTCHDAAPAASDYSYQGKSAYARSGHGVQQCSVCHDPHGVSQGTTVTASMLRTPEEGACYPCHPSVYLAMVATTTPLAHHSVDASEQALYSSKIECVDCHQPHLSSAATPVVDPRSRFSAAYTSRVPDPKLAPLSIATIPVTADAEISQSSPTVNYGRATTITVSSSGGIERRAFLLVDGSSLPDNISVSTCRLMVWGRVATGSVDIRPVMMGWREGSGTGQVNSAAIDGVTWYERFFGDNLWNGTALFDPLDPDWYQQGRDYGSFSSNWTSVDTTPSALGWHSYDLGGVFGDGVNYEQSIALSIPSGRTDTMTVASRDSSDPAHRPYVYVTYTTKNALQLLTTSDTWVSSGAPTANHGTDQYLYIGDCSAQTGGAVTDGKALVRFDMSGIPASATVTKATMRITSDSPILGAGMFVSAVTRDWRAGTGNGSVNGPSIDGATWLESRYGDNLAGTGPEDWATPGGDATGTVLGTYDASGYTFEAADLVNRMRANGNYGFLIQGGSGVFRSVDLGALYGAYLDVEWSLPDTRTTVPDATGFCLRCHDNDWQATRLGTQQRVGTAFGHDLKDFDIGYFYMPANTAAPGTWDLHGKQTWTGAQLQAGGPTRKNGLKPPYRYDMEPLPCTECHDPHGSRNPYHLRETVNGVGGLVLDKANGAGGTWTGEQKQTAAWCGSCHYLDVHATSGMYGSCLGSCHYHGSGHF